MTELQRNTIPRVLIIAGSDSGGGAGIQGDIKTVTCLGGYATTAITALTAQNTLGVFGVHPVPPEFIAQQIALVLSDIGADAIKTGMLHSAEVIDAVVDALCSMEREKYQGHFHEVRGGTGAAARPPEKIPLIVDPVMVAKGGSPLLQESAITALKTRLIPLATLLTPNLPEASLLIGRDIHTLADMEAAIPALRALGAENVLLKGGHLLREEKSMEREEAQGADHEVRGVRGGPACIASEHNDLRAKRAGPPVNNLLTDLLITPTDTHTFTSPRIDTRHTHGTGCTLASAIATHLGAGHPIEKAVEFSRNYVHAAILNAPGFGQGHGPLGHNVSMIDHR